MADLLDSSTKVVMGLLVSIILVCSALVPVALDQINALTQRYGTDVSQYTTMLEVVIILAIVGLIIGVVRTYTHTSEAD